MKKILIAVIALCCTNFANSQLHFFVEGGINLSRPANGQRQLGAPSQESRTGITATAGLLKKFRNGFGLSNRISFITKKVHETFFVGPDYMGTNDYSLSGFQYHLVLEKDLTAKKKLHMLPFAGLYTLVHISGDLDFEHSTFAGLIKGSRKLDFDSNGDFSRWDAGATIGIRIQYKKLSVATILDLGLKKVDPGSDVKWIGSQFVLGYFIK